jgi:hypothetical protein
MEDSANFRSGSYSDSALERCPPVLAAIACSSNQPPSKAWVVALENTNLERIQYPSFDFRQSWSSYTDQRVSLEDIEIVLSIDFDYYDLIRAINDQALGVVDISSVLWQARDIKVIRRCCL